MGYVGRFIIFLMMNVAYIMLYIGLSNAISGTVGYPTDLFKLIIICSVAFITTLVTGGVILRITKGKPYQIGALIRYAMATSPWSALLYLEISNAAGASDSMACKMYRVLIDEMITNSCFLGDSVGLVGSYTYGDYSLFLLLGGHIAAIAILVRKAIKTAPPKPAHEPSSEERETIKNAQVFSD